MNRCPTSGQGGNNEDDTRQGKSKKWEKQYDKKKLAKNNEILIWTLAEKYANAKRFGEIFWESGGCLCFAE